MGESRIESILDSNGQPTSQCYVSRARSGLHCFFKRAMFEEIYDTPTSSHSHTAYVGDEQVELTTSELRGYPVVNAEPITVAPYICEVTLSYT